MNRPFTFISAAAIAFLTACAPSHDYLGQRFPPTEAVTVYYPHQTVPDGYVLIGTNTTEASVDVTAEEIVAQVVAKAQEVGAHAIVVDSIEVIFAGTTHTTDVEHDEHGYSERHRTSDRRVKVLRATFLRRAE